MPRAKSPCSVARSFFVAAIWATASLGGAETSDDLFLDESFADLARWEPLTFSDVPEHSRYVVQLSFPNPYTKRVRMIVLRGPDAPLGEWREEQIHILEDYREQFESDPPENATLGIMTDSDDTGGTTRSAIDYIRVSRE